VSCTDYNDVVSWLPDVLVPLNYRGVLRSMNLTLPLKMEPAAPMGGKIPFSEPFGTAPSCFAQNTEFPFSPGGFGRPHISIGGYLNAG